MTFPNLFLLYVADVPASAAFYAGLLGATPAMPGPTYAAFDLPGGGQLALWSTSTVTPDAKGSGHRSEIAFALKDEAAVTSLLADWTARGLTIEQPLTQTVFGPTFVANDLDGHRLRVLLAD